jgi:3-oxoacyl-[acyl-carrier-protein] synthase-3
MTAIGIASTGVYFPPQTENASSLAMRTGIPEEIIKEKFGLYEKHVADDHTHASDLAIRAAKAALEGFDPNKIDVVIYFGSPHKDYPVWSAANKIQHELGAKNAYAFETMSVSANFPITLKVAKDMLISDPSIQYILLAGGCKESTLIDYGNARSRFMFNFADGGAAALISRTTASNRILGSGFVTDGSFHHYVKVPAGGTVQPATHETINNRMHYIDVTDPLAMKEQLDPVSVRNFITAIEKALASSGYKVEDIDWILPLHTKKSMLLELLGRLGLREEQAIYLDHYGHMSALDPLIGFHFLKQHKPLKPGDLIVMVSAGTGYTWSSTVVEWIG